MPKIKEIIIASLLPATKQVGKEEMKEVLKNIRQNNEASVYKTTVLSLYANFSLLKRSAIKTKTNIDDGIIDIVLETIQEIADADNLILS